MPEELPPPKPENKSRVSTREILGLIGISIVWIGLFALSFFTYFSIPFLIFISWIMIAWLIRIFKRDEKEGSGYDRNF